MTHWYGWAALALVSGLAAHDIAVLVINAWRGRPTAAAPFWIAVWVTIAVALLSSKAGG